MLLVGFDLFALSAFLLAHHMWIADELNWRGGRTTKRFRELEKRLSQDFKLEELKTALK